MVSSTASILSGIKKAWFFYGGEGGTKLGEMYHAAKTTAAKKGAKSTLSLFSADTFNKCYKNHLNNVASAAKSTGAKGFFRTLLGKFSKILTPAMLIVPELMSAYEEIKNGGGIGGALKALGKGAINLTAYPIASFAVAAFGLTGGWALAATFIGSYVVGLATSKIATAVLGKTNTELIAEQQAQQGGQAEIAGTSNGSNQRTLASIDAQIKETDEFLKRFDINSDSCISTTQNFNNYGTYPNSNKRVFIA